MKTYTEAELKKLQDSGTAVIRRPKQKLKKKPAPVAAQVTPPAPAVPDTQKVVDAAERVLSAADKQKEVDNTLADRLAEAINQHGAPSSFECTITHRDNQGRLKRFRIDPVAKS